jgi:hypothetical protein
MKTKSEVIQKIHYQVDNWDDQQELLRGTGKPTEKKATTHHQHVQLCSPNSNQATISAYSVTLHREHGISDFLESLSLFLGVRATLPQLH